ncbi:ABC transporter substrate-binding protein [Selenihalanaerobacter shriftii]|uniref:Multiple sugar transport system substrate-binding protein n=1 Tax=Selenihalanaerobacter shriftii TaxID=142842 RepID=A0A1T4LQQ2_9FIRM|nr:extracellular solute-binding protein [Selenihalanaerobacter shriftii]SJZ56956.1 multiple sugar transport system substrate-binding protein [Selenihalanaerobacter shriftii]
MLEKLKSNFDWPILIGMIGLIIIVTSALTFYLSYKDQQGFTIDPKVELVADKEYQITYWDYPLFIGQDAEYKKFLQETITEFNDMYPNIKVKYELLSFIEGRNKLKKRLTEGKPPDIYNDLFGTKLISEEYQIPVNIFFAENEIEDYNQLGTSAFTYDQKVWGLPNWLLPQVWVGNRKLLTKTDLDLSRVKEKGWPWETFYQTAKEIKGLNKKSCIIFNPYNSELFYQLLSMNDSQELVSKEGKLLLTEKNLKGTFEYLDDLRSHKVFYEEPEEMNKKLLPYFWQGRAGVIAPVNLWLLNNLYQRDKKEKNVELTLLPIPTNDPEVSKVPLKVRGLVLFRQEEYKGDDHTKAVYKFAKFLNQQKSLFIAKKLRVVPSYLPLISHWKQEVNLTTDIQNQLLTYVDRGSYKELSGFNNEKLELEIKQVIDERYESFWLEGESIPKVSREILNIAEDILNVTDNEKNKVEKKNEDKK